MIANMVLKWLEKLKNKESPEPIGYVLQINFQKDDSIKSINYAVVNKPEALHTHWVAKDKVMLLCLDEATVSIDMSLVATFRTIPIQNYSDLLDLALVRKSANEKVLGMPIADVIRSRMNG